MFYKYKNPPLSRKPPVDIWCNAIFLGSVVLKPLALKCCLFQSHNIHVRLKVGPKVECSKQQPLHSLTHFYNVLF